MVKCKEQAGVPMGLASAPGAVRGQKPPPWHRGSDPGLLPRPSPALAGWRGASAPRPSAARVSARGAPQPGVLVKLPPAGPWAPDP